MRKVDNNQPPPIGSGATRAPTLLVRGSESDVITIDDAHHMVAGDDNAIFDVTIKEFLDRRVGSDIDRFANRDDQ